eukprot:g62.t1
MGNAALEGDIDLLKSLILQGYNIESSDTAGYSVLSEAACTGHEEIVKLLLNLGADPNTYGVQKGPHGDQMRTPLSRATNMGYFNVVKMLLEAGAYSEPALILFRGNDLKFLNLLKEYPRERSEKLISKRKEKMLKMCSHHLRQWSEDDQRKFYHQQLSSKVILCAQEGNADELVRLLEEHTQREIDENPNLSKSTVTAESIKDSSGRNALAIAAWKGHYSCVERLLTEWKNVPTSASRTYQSLRRKIFKVDVNTRFHFNKADGWTPLAIAIHMKYPDICSLLRRCGANPLLGTEFHEDAFELCTSGAVKKALKELAPNTSIRQIPMIKDKSHERYLRLENRKSSEDNNKMGIFERTFRRHKRLKPEEVPEDEEILEGLKEARAKDTLHKEKRKSLNEQRRSSRESSFHSLQLGLGYDRFNAKLHFAPENLLQDSVEPQDNV